MLPKKFILAVANEDGDYFSSYHMSRIRLILMGSGLVALVLGATVLTAVLLRRTDQNFRSRELAQKNKTLTQAFKTWEIRIQRLETELKDVQRRNHQLRTTAFLSLPEVEYGVGGPESLMKTGLFEYSEMQPIEWDLNKIETQIKTLELSTTELENTISKKTLEIAHYPSIQPVRGGWLSSSFGKRIDPFTGKIEDHAGIDISIKPGSEVYAAGAGIVKEAVTRFIPNKGYGMYIVIDHGFGYETLYGHLSKIFVRQGQQVKRWDLIGLTGDTGKSTSPHLHYGVLVDRDPKNPIHFILE